MPEKGIPSYLQRLQLIRETSFGVPVDPITSGDRMNIVIPEGDAGMIREEAGVISQRTARGKNRPGKQDVASLMVPFRFWTYMYTSQAVRLVNWAAGLSVPVGEVRDVLPSWAAYTFDGYAYRPYLGLRVDRAVFRSEAGTGGTGWVRGEFSGVAIKEDHDLTIDADDFGGAETEPSGDCYRHIDSEGQIIAAGNVLTSCRGLTITIANINDHQHTGGMYIDRNSFNGRDITVSIDCYSDDNVYYDLFHDQDPADLEVGWEIGANRLRFIFTDYAWVSNHTRRRQFGRDVMETLSWTAHENPGTGTDVTLDVA